MQGHQARSLGVSRPEDLHTAIGSIDIEHFVIEAGTVFQD